MVYRSLSDFVVGSSCSSSSGFISAALEKSNPLLSFS